MTMTGAERQQKRRERLKGEGGKIIQVALSAAAAATLERLQAQTKRTQTDCIELALKVAGKKFLTDTKEASDKYLFEDSSGIGAPF